MKGEIAMHGSRADFPVVSQSGAFYAREVEWGDMNGAFWGFPAGFDSAPLFKGMPKGCECPHWGYLLKGRMRVRYADHEEVITAGEAYYLAPGHIPVMEEDCEMVEFSPKDESRRMMEAIGHAMASQ
jgi:hypothetical protein